TIDMICRGVAEFTRDMPGNRFAFPIRVRSQVDPFDLPSFSAELLQELFFALDRHVFRRKIMRRINPETMLRQILDVPDGCLHRKASPEIFFNSSGFGGRFNNDQRLRHGSVTVPCISKFRSTLSTTCEESARELAY